MKNNFLITAHANQFTSGGLKVGVDNGAVSVDHLEVITDQEIDYDDETVNQFMEADFRRNKRTISLSFEYKFGEFKKKKYIRENSQGYDRGGEGGMNSAY